MEIIRKKDEENTKENKIEEWEQNKLQMSERRIGWKGRKCSTENHTSFLVT